MADEQKETQNEPREEEEKVEESAATADHAEVTVVDDASAQNSEENPEDPVEQEASGKSPEEIAAEQAMLGMMEETEAASAENGEEAGPGVAAAGNLDLLMDVGLQVSVELGRKDMKFREVLQLGKGSLVELNKIADEPVDIYVNQSKIAEGEVVVVDDHFGVRITRLLNDAKSKKLD